MFINGKERQIIFYDFEVFKHDWMVVFRDRDTKKTFSIVNNTDLLLRFWKKHKDDIFVGYNSRSYDVNIFKGILLGKDPYMLTKALIEDEMKGFQVLPDGHKVQLYNFDVFDGQHSLKQLEGFMGNNIHETSVDFKIQRKLTKEEIDLTLKYCSSDVYNTAEVFELSIKEFKAQTLLIDAFELDMSLFNKTKAQLSAIILGAIKRQWDDEFDFRFPNTAILGKYQFVKEWFENPYNQRYKTYTNKHLRSIYGDESKTTYELNLGTKAKPKNVLVKRLEGEYPDDDFIARIAKELNLNAENGKKANQLLVDIMGVPHVIGYGGIHGAIAKYIGKGTFVMSDVASLYPSIMIEYLLLSRNVEDPSKYKDMRDRRLKLKREKNPIQEALKIVLNGTYGASKDKFNNLYDALMANCVCITGQLLLIDLIEKIEVWGKCDLIQSNTDGILVKLHNANYYDEYVEICKEWEKRVRLELEHDIYHDVYQKDVNNYIIIQRDENGNIAKTKDGKEIVKRKGAYVKKLSKLDNDLPIVNEALTELIVHGTPIEETVNKCNEMIKFQKIVKVTSKYDGVIHNGKKQEGKVFRIYATKEEEMENVMKYKGESTSKIGYTPNHARIINEDVNEMTIPKWLDREYYIEMAKNRQKDFGYKEPTQMELIF